MSINSFTWLTHIENNPGKSLSLTSPPLPSPNKKETIETFAEEEMETKISATGKSPQPFLMPPQMLLKSMLVSALKTTFEIRTPSRA